MLKFVFLIGLLLSCFVSAEPEKPLHEIAYSQQWMVLGHYHKSFGQYQSKVTSPAFFLSNIGNHDPVAELKATLEVFNSDDVANQCRYPARYLFLVQKKAIDPIDYKALCSEYREYTHSLPVKGMSLVYASGFLGNPASMFGHLLLRLNLDQSSRLLDNTFNFGAIVPPQDSKLTYIFKGVTGGYVSRFSDEPFYHHSNVYNEDELRNMWEYPLNLTDEQLELLLAHRYELREATFDYYFFTENCAYQLAYLLGLVHEGPVLETKYPWVLPIDVITALADEANSLMGNARREPSRQQLFYDRYRQLSGETQAVLASFLKGRSSIEEVLESAAGEEQKKQVVEVLLDYFSYIESREEVLSSSQAQQRQKLLVARFSMGIGSADWLPSKVVAPHQTQRPSLIRVSHKWGTEERETLLRVRGTYYDELSINEPENNFSALETMNFIFSDREKHFLKRLDLVNVRNLKPDSTSLDGDEQYAWTLRFGFKPAQLNCQNCLVGYVDGGFGKAFGNELVSSYGLITSRLQTHRHGADTLYTGLELGTIIKPLNWWRAKVAFHSEVGLNTSNQNDSVSFEQAFGNSLHWDIRNGIRFNNSDAFVTIGAGYYW